MRTSLVALLAGLAAGTALAGSPVPARPYFAANCFGCHGTDGRSTGAIQPLAGRDRLYLKEALSAFKTGARQATIMDQLAKGYTDEELAILADFFSRQAR
jgi:cytochrome c553